MPDKSSDPDPRRRRLNRFDVQVDHIDRLETYTDPLETQTAREIEEESRREIRRGAR